MSGEREPVTLDDVARQLDGVLAELFRVLYSIRNDVKALTTIVQDVAAREAQLMAEMRALDSQVASHEERLSRLEGLAPSTSEETTKRSA